MRHGRADEGPHGFPVLLREQVRSDRAGDEHEADQRGRRGADQQIEVMPGVNELGERQMHVHELTAHGHKRFVTYLLTYVK
jgi:hypothetical protein